MNPPIVRVIAHTLFKGVPEELRPFGYMEASIDKFQQEQDAGSEMARLIECAGRTCYTGDTEILLEDGWCRFDMYQMGKSVATLNMDTGKIEFLKPDAYIDQNYDGELIEINGRRISLAVTPDHNMVVKTTNGLTLIPAEQLLKRPYSIPKFGLYDGREPEDIVIPEYHYVQPTGNQYGATGESDRATPGLTIAKECLESFAEFLGWYIAEGCLAGGNGTGQRVTIYQKDENAQPIIDAIEGIGWSYTKLIDSRNGVAQITVGISALARWLRQWGVGSFEKRIPDFVFHWPLNLRQKLIDTAFAGDGTVFKNGRRCYNTRSEGLAIDLQRLLVISGKPASFGSTLDNNKKMYRVYEGIREFTEIKPRMQSRTPYNDKVYCVSTKNKTLLVRRNGKIVVCGNCYDSYGVGRSSAEYHDHILKVGHGSVLEHASISFYFDNISRGCSHELVRHRVGTAISQRSTRFVDESEGVMCWHPLIHKFILEAPDDNHFKVRAAIQDAENKCREAYRLAASVIEQKLIKSGADKQTARKQARGAARGVMPNALETAMVWSVNIRALRGVLEQRCSPFADAEIRLLYNGVFVAAKQLVPEYFSDYERVCCQDGIGFGLETSHRKV